MLIWTKSASSANFLDREMNLLIRLFKREPMTDSEISSSLIREAGAIRIAVDETFWHHL